MNHKPSVRDRFARVAAFAAIASVVLAVLFVPIVSGHSPAAAASQEKLGAPQQATVAPTEAPPVATEPPPVPTVAPTEPPPVPTVAPTEPPPVPTVAPTEPPPAPTAVSTKAPPAPTAVPTKTPPAPTATPKPADPKPADPAPAQAQPTPTVVPTVAAPIASTQTVSGGVACTVSIRTGLSLRATAARSGKALGVILRTETFKATGRTANSGWVFGVNTKGVQGWVLSNGLRCTKPVRQLAVVNVQNAPAPKATPKP